MYLKCNGESIVIQLMEVGVIGVSLLYALNNVEEEQKPETDNVTILLHKMVVKTVMVHLQILRIVE